MGRTLDDAELERRDAETKKLGSEARHLDASTGRLVGWQGAITSIATLVSVLTAIVSVGITSWSASKADEIQEKVAAAETRLQDMERTIQALRDTNDEAVVRMLSVALIVQKLAADNPALFRPEPKGYQDHGNRLLALSVAAYNAMDEATRRRIEAKNSSLVADALKTQRSQ
jgi:hypothetical protein